MSLSVALEPVRVSDRYFAKTEVVWSVDSTWTTLEKTLNYRYKKSFNSLSGRKGGQEVNNVNLQTCRTGASFFSFIFLDGKYP